jgi:hypothetical protein
MSIAEIHERRAGVLSELFKHLPAHPITEVPELNRALLMADQLGNLISPVSSVDYIPQMHAVSFRYVFLEDGVDTYHDKKFCGEHDRALSRKGILKLWRTAAGRDIYSKRTDDGTDPLLREYEAAVALRGVDGKEVDTIKRREVDLRPGAVQIAGMTEKQLAHNRQMIGTFSEGKAHNRAVRQAMNLRQKYTVDELLRPFIIPVLLPLLDTSDVQIRRLVAAHALGVVGDLYGGNRRQLQAPPQADTVVVDRTTGEDVTDAEVVKDEPEDIDLTLPPEEAAAPLEVCGCPVCGCQAEVAKETAAQVKRVLGAVRCKACFPSSGFDFARHSRGGNLSIPARPKLTVESLRKHLGA